MRAVPRCGLVQIIPRLIFAPIGAILLAHAAWHLLCRLLGWEDDIAFDEDSKPAPRLLGALFISVIGVVALTSLAKDVCIEVF